MAAPVTVVYEDGGNWAYVTGIVGFGDTTTPDFTMEGYVPVCIYVNNITGTTNSANLSGNDIDGAGKQSLISRTSAGMTASASAVKGRQYHLFANAAAGPHSARVTAVFAKFR